jgi:hypothetical protein
MVYIIYTSTSRGNMYTRAVQIVPVRLISSIKINFQLNWDK